jgi:hypothetical protein
MTYVTNKRLEAWGVEFAEAYEAAIENLRAISLPPKFAWHIEGLYISTYSDDYDPSRLLLPEVISELNVKGDPVAMLPNRSTLLVTGADDLYGLRAMADFTASLVDKPRFRSGIPVRLVDGRWRTYRLPDSHPACQAFRSLWAESICRDCQKQKKELDEFHRRHGVGLHVASCFISEDPASQEKTSVCCWGWDMTSLLPKTDLVAIVKAPDMDNTILVPWEALTEVVGDLLVPVGLYPERYLVQEFPNGEQFALLRAKYDVSDRLLRSTGE